MKEFLKLAIIGVIFVLLMSIQGIATSQPSAQTLMNQLPKAVFSYSPSSPMVGTSIFFDGSLSWDNDGSVKLYQWDFGDGTKGAGALYTHAFWTAGTFLVALTVTDDRGASGTLSGSITVSATPALVRAPIGLTANGVSPSQIDLAWQHPAGVAGFEIERRLERGSWFPRETVGLQRTFSDTMLAEGTRYCYRVRAFSPGGPGISRSDYSNEACATTPRRLGTDEQVVQRAEISRARAEAVRWYRAALLVKLNGVPKLNHYDAMQALYDVTGKFSQDRWERAISYADSQKISDPFLKTIDMMLHLQADQTLEDMMRNYIGLTDEAYFRWFEDYLLMDFGPKFDKSPCGDPRECTDILEYLANAIEIEADAWESQDLEQLTEAFRQEVWFAGYVDSLDDYAEKFGGATIQRTTFLYDLRYRGTKVVDLVYFELTFLVFTKDEMEEIGTFLDGAWHAGNAAAPWFTPGTAGRLLNMAQLASIAKTIGAAAGNIELYDLSGAKVDHAVGSGATWATRLARAGRSLANGVYFYLITVTNPDGKVLQRQVGRLVVLR
ncbi:MAG: hypothetical protein A2Z21_05450 [Candidatus Fraserbacteria bacterium RBG_16_55_9]|uniref:PKD domain-containing protein n=1 Tax=Fraserbacteria sp. (strain RBG_16_55_9) TaxID=1817864 RepID=A0A1F5V2N8_FRAXR|nr:MAG: hypothetical protein A2Z21_05450 [Candidatus Fraserbacteria bacterium RBG_16_55_9]